MICLDQRSHRLSRSRACDALGLSRTGTYPRPPRPRPPRPRRSQASHAQPRKISEAEQDEVLEVVNSEAHEDACVRVIHARELDQASWMLALRVSSIYRMLRRCGQTTERRNQRPPQNYAVPRIIARAPNEAWSWDISKLPTFTRGVISYL
ncbi:MAG: hypothetical protein U5K43_13740 [Halofilum sp. (in: g-proteobacteria)]|nr:hypothetical protein [Halofilum sp. (in: g-proteobacteria)]